MYVCMYIYIYIYYYIVIIGGSRLDDPRALRASGRWQDVAEGLWSRV